MLGDYQLKLASHFSNLRSVRSGTGYPVFALEHPLSPDEINLLVSYAAASGRASGRLRDDHWLVWVIVATEIGYNFSGDEYWQTFGDSVDGWRRFGKRDRIRSWFQRFVELYDGVRPCGPWAEHRTIISWPITHAILPNDLQSPFMREFHALRHVLAGSRDCSTDQLGHLFAANCSTPSSRLRSFLEQASLVGRLVSALSSVEITQTVPPIAAEALDRLVKDLEHDAARKIRLADARRTFKEARLRLSRSLSAYDQVSVSRGSTQPPNSLGGCCLTAAQSSNGNWRISASLPTLRDFTTSRPGVAIAISRAAIRFFDSPDRPRPAALLLQGRIERQLIELPERKTALVRFEGALRNSLQEAVDAYSMPDGDHWLLRVQADGIARQVLGSYVRPSQKYLIVCRAPLLPTAWLSNGILKQTSCETLGAHVYELDMPARISEPQRNDLDKIGLGYRFTITVEAVGLVPRTLAQDGASEWLTTEEVMLSLRPDLDVFEYEVAVMGHASCRFQVENTAATLIGLGRLAAGTHDLTVTARTGLADRSQLLRADFRLQVRSPNSLGATLGVQAGIRADLLPMDARLEDILTGRAKIHVVGPLGRDVDVSCVCKFSSQLPTQALTIGRMQIPFSASRFQDLMRTHEESLLATESVVFRFDCGDLGSSSVEVQHDAAPLRWLARKGNAGYSVRLIDESDNQRVKLRQASMLEPDRFSSLSADPRTGPIEVLSPGVLYCASLEGRQYAIFTSVPSEGNFKRLEDLQLNVALNPNKRGRRDFTNYLGVLRLWSNTHVVGKLGLLRREQIIAAVEQRLLSIACGARWVEPLLRVRRGQHFNTDLPELQQSVGGAPGFAAQVRRTLWNNEQETFESSIQQMMMAASAHYVCADARLVRAAMTFAFNPTALWMKRDDPFALELLQYRALLRGAALAAALSLMTPVQNRQIA